MKPTDLSQVPSTPAPQEPNELQRMLKVFNWVNDTSRPKVNIKFLGLLAALLLVGGMLVAYAAFDPSLTQEDAAGGAVAAEERTEHVGLTAAEAELYALDPARAEAVINQRMDAWGQAHAQDEVVALERTFDEGGRWTGYEITYRPGEA